MVMLLYVVDNKGPFYNGTSCPLWAQKRTFEGS